ncbi:molybdopterin-guanine dinucleotide biosynthesis protein MobB [Staphylococcus aureus]
MILQIVSSKKSGKTTLMRHIVFSKVALVIQLLLLNIMGMVRKMFNYQDSDVDHMKHFEAGADQSIVQGFDISANCNTCRSKSYLNL